MLQKAIVQHSGVPDSLFWLSQVAKGLGKQNSSSPENSGSMSVHLTDWRCHSLMIMLVSCDFSLGELGTNIYFPQGKPKKWSHTHLDWWTREWALPSNCYCFYDLRVGPKVSELPLLPSPPASFPASLISQGCLFPWGEAFQFRGSSHTTSGKQSHSEDTFQFWP